MPVAPSGAFYLADGNDTKGKPKYKLWWRSNEKQPNIMARNLEIIEGERYARRPSALAKKENKRRSSDVLKADEYQGNRGDWASVESMPHETQQEDTGWKAGPVVRELPKFNGPKPGPTNVNFDKDTSEVDIMLELITPRFKKKCREFTQQHRWSITRSTRR